MAACQHCQESDYNPDIIDNIDGDGCCQDLVLLETRTMVGGTAPEVRSVIAAAVQVTTARQPAPHAWDTGGVSELACCTVLYMHTLLIGEMIDTATDTP